MALAPLITKPVRKTINCTSCHNTFRIWQEGPATIKLNEAQFKYCPVCGEPTLRVSLDNDLNYWETLGEAYGYPAKIIESIYDAWDPTEHRNFGEFIKVLKDELHAELESDRRT